MEERNFEIRKNLLEYDEVMDEQRKRVYGYRQKILDGANCRDLILEMIREQVDHHVAEFLNKDYGVESFAKWAGAAIWHDLRDRAISAAWESKKPSDMPTTRPNGWRRLRFSMRSKKTCRTAKRSRSGIGKPRQTRQCSLEFESSRSGFEERSVGEHVSEMLIEKAREAIRKVDLTEGAPMLEEDFGLRTTVAWAKYKFGFELARRRDSQARSRSDQGLVDPTSGEAYDAKSRNIR